MILAGNEHLSYVPSLYGTTYLFQTSRHKVNQCVKQNS